MGALVRNLYNVNGRWKYRKAVPQRLRRHIDGGITEFVRWLGAGAGQPSPDIVSRFGAAEAECARLIAMAEKRAIGQFDEIGPDVIAHIVSLARSEMLEDDEEARFDQSEERGFNAVREQLNAVDAVVNMDPDRRFNKRQDALSEALEVWRHEYARGRISEFVKEEAGDRCAALGLRVDPLSVGFQRLGKAYLSLLIEVAEASLKRQAGEPVPTPEPPVTSLQRAASPQSNQTLSGLVDGWWREAEAAGKSVSTHEAYRRVVRQFSSFLGHDDASAITAEDVVRFKDFRIEQGASLKTVKDSDLSGLKAVFAWGVNNKRLDGNPAEGVKTQKIKKARSRSAAFTDEEATKLLSHALHHKKRPGESENVAAAKRWVPWLCAYTGARVGEMVQLRKEDIFEQAGHIVVRISPEAGSVKTGDFRVVPLHPHLVELGFTKFVETCPDGHLFMRVIKEGKTGARGAWRTVKNRVTEFAREVITDRRVQPNHGWRHRMETLARDYEFRKDTSDAITGRPGQDVASRYGDFSIRAMASAISRLPRYEIKGR